MDKLKWTTEKRKIKDLLPAEYNPRQMTERQAKELRKSLEKFDLVEIPAVNTDGIILAGHQRLHILGLMGRGDEEIDVRVPNRPLTELEAQEYNLRSNKNTGEWDMDKLFAMPEGLLEEVGFSNKEIQSLIDGHTEAKEDDYDVEEGIKTPIRVEIGEIWQLGSHRLMCADSTDPVAIQKLMDGKKADMVFTDPPYGVSYVGKTKEALTIENDAMSEDDTAELWKMAYGEMREILKEGGLIYATVPAGPLHLIFAQVMKDWEDLRQIMVWVKDRFVMGRSDYHYRHEPILYGWKSGGSHEFHGGRDKDTVWEIARPSASREHPTMKPVALVEKAIKEGSPMTGKVYDPFGGSGSTLIACEQTNRVCYMMEIDPKYCTVILDRWEKLTGKKAEKVAY